MEEAVIMNIYDFINIAQQNIEEANKYEFDDDNALNPWCFSLPHKKWQMYLNLQILLSRGDIRRRTANGIETNFSKMSGFP